MNGSLKPREIVIFSQFYDPEPCAASNRVGSLARTLAKCGNRVTVYTGMPSFPKGSFDPPYDALARCVEHDGPVRIVRRRARLAKGRFGGRFAYWISLACVLSWVAIAELDGADTVIVSSPPITMAIPALLAAWRHRAKLVVDVRDVFPDMGLRLGVWKERGALVRALSGFVSLLYRRAAMIVAVTPTARASILARGIAPAKVALAPNGFEFAAGVPARIPRNGKRTFEVAYAGNMGLATGLDLVLDAAKLLSADPSIRILLAGGGVDAERLAARIRDEGLQNVAFLGVLTRSSSLELLARADAAIIPLHGSLVDALPSKMFDALAVGCPMVVSARGEAQRLLAATKSGVEVEPNDARALADGILACRRNAAALEQRSQLGRAFVREHYDRERIMRTLAVQIEALA
jgi:glycosyltransferase involved in cell wall biosynthesis